MKKLVMKAKIPLLMMELSSEEISNEGKEPINDGAK